MPTYPTVPYGPFRGCTIADLRSAKRAYVNSASAGGFNSKLSGASVNGQSYSFSGQEYTREEFGEQLAAAFLSLGSDEFGLPLGHSGAARF
jgi:hypothetical protein